MGMIRVVLFGTPCFAIPTLESIWKDNSTTLVGVVTQPDRPAGRGQEICPPPVKSIAIENGIPLIQTKSVRDDPDVIQFLQDIGPDVAIVASFGQFLSSQIFEFPKYGTLNIHPSLLPLYRGAAPIAHTLLNGDRLTGVSVMKINGYLDSGPILGMEEFSISPEANTGELEDALAKLGADLFLRLLHPYVSGTLVPAPQNESMATSAPAILKADSSVNWEWSSTRIHNLVRAFNPNPGARTILRGNLIKLWKTRIVSEVHTDQHLPIGSATQFGKRRVRVTCGDRSLIELVQIQPANSRRMSASEFANGVRLREGEVFG